MERYLSILKKYWGYSSFRQVQEQIIQSIADGKDTLGIMPTGGGKSITFQVPALAMDGVCIVVSPLIALMNDQVDRLNSMEIKARALHSGMRYPELMTTLDNAVYGVYKFLYVSPERLSTEVFRTKLTHMPVSLIAVDESHCISQWGYDFRPSYLHISKLREYFPDVPILALTATATPEVINDIQDKLQFRNRNLIQGSFTRKNLVYFVRQSNSKIADLIKLLQSVRGSGIIYLRNRKKTKEIADYLQQQHFSADYYHAGLSYEVRQHKQEQWAQDHTRIMVATNAFGMGIDKSNVRFVIHMDLPDSPEAYIQEAGRAGRDEKKAFAVLLASPQDKTQAAKRLATNFPPIDEIKEIYGKLGNYLRVPLGGGKGMSYDFQLNDFATQCKLNAAKAFSSLQMLQKQGYIEHTDELNNPSRILFIINRDDLYKFQIKNKKFDGFIKLLLRSYTGLFSDYTRIDEEVLSKRANIPREMVYQYLVKLGQMKVISYIPGRKSPLIVYTEERLNEKDILIPFDYYSERKERFKKRMDAMLEYAFSSNECRNNLILKYFGQPAAEPCEACDVCKSKMDHHSDPHRVELLENKILNVLKKNPVYLGELQLNLELKEDALNDIIIHLIAEEKVYYLEDGQLALKEK